MIDGLNNLIDWVISILTPIGITEPVFQFMLVAALLGLSIYLTLHTGMFSLANAGFMAIGAYVSVILTQEFDQPLWVGILGGMIAAGIIAIPIGLPVLRLRDIYLAIATIGFSEVVRIILLNFDDIVSTVLTSLEGERVRFRLLNGGRGIRPIPKLTETWMLVLFLIAVMFMLDRLARSRLGRAMVAIRQDEKAAANMGINVVYVKTMAFVLGAVLAGAAGGFNAHLKGIITPADFDFTLIVDILAYAVLGGTTIWVGPVVGALVLRAMPEVLRDLNQYRGVFNGLVLLLVIIYIPNGLINPAGWKRVWNRYFRRREPTTQIIAESE
ncbi:MAG: branched-chain amino acid ABC transporter permease [Phototrophicales bacterium]